MKPSPAPPSRGLTKHTRLRLADALHIEARGPLIHLEAQAASVQQPRSALALLGFFESPRTVEEGWQFLGAAAKGAPGLADAFERIRVLVDAGILVAEGSPPVAPVQRIEGGFGPLVQIHMLEDRERTARYLQAIRQTVRPGDVVVDVGTGSGVLALTAAQAGAARVYAIESQPIAEAAARVFQASGLGDRITLLRGLSTELDLPEKADVLVSEIIGNEPFDERIVETTRDAAVRFLKPGARLVPARLRVLATPVEVPQAARQRHFFTPEFVGRWERWYGLPLAVLAQVGGDFERCMVHPWDLRDWPALAEPMPLVDVALDDPAPTLAGQASVTVARPGPLGGWLLHFEADLVPGVSLSTQADRVKRRNHWKTPLWLLREPRAVAAGERLSLAFEVHKGRVELKLA